MLSAFRSLFQRSADTGPVLFDEAFLRRLERLSLQADRSLRGGIVGAHRSTRRIPAMEMVDRRPYAPGDDLRYVDWHAFARHDHVFVKLGEAHQDVPVHILLDHSASMGYGDPPKLHAAARLAAAIGYIALAQADVVTVTRFAQHVEEAFGPSQSKRQAPALLKYLEGVRPSTGAAGMTELADALRHMGRSRAGGLLVLISDLMADGWPQALRPLRPPRWQALVLHVLDPQELDPRLDDDLDLVDAETGARVAVSSADAALSIYRERVEHWTSDVQALCGRLGAGYARVQTNWPVEQVVIPYLQRRKMLR